MDIIKLQILTDQPDLRAELVEKLKVIEYLKVEKPVHFQGDLKESFTTDTSDVVLISEHYLGDGYRASEIITTEFPYKTVILLEDELSTSNVRKAVTSGASDIISPNSTTEELTEVIYQAHMQHLKKQDMLLVSKKQKSNLEGKIYTVFSTKGGTGKTFVSTNLAVALAKQTGKKVVLFDLDLDYGGDSIALNTPVKYSMANVINEIRNIDEDLMDGFLLTHESGVRILAANPEPSFNDYVNSDHIELILRTLQSSFDYIVVDMPGRFMETVNPAFSMADAVLLITTPEVLTLKNIKASLLVFKELNYPISKLRIILNKASNLGINRKDVEATLGSEIFSEIPEDIKGARNSQNQGVPYVTAFPRSSTTAGFTKLISALTNSQEKAKNRWW
ncbi:Iron-sulfur cluster carrier protein [anaerobic digester metagenome]